MPHRPSTPAPRARLRQPLGVLGAALAAATAALVAGCGGPSGDASGGAAAEPLPADTAVARAELAMSRPGLFRDVAALAADSMEGRAPATPGEDKTVAFLTREFQAIGLAPGNPDGSWVQQVELIGYTSRPTASFTAGGKTIPLSFPDDYVANSRHERAATTVAGSDVVFVGYGVVAPEYGWDDYKGVDVRGKTILMLVNDPAVAVPGAPPGDTTRLDSAMFRGRAMTYYGRWTYKYEIASEKGAAAAIIIHETGPAGYPYDVVRSGYSIEQFDVPSPDAERRVPVEGWITLPKARELLAASGLKFDSLKAAAASRDFRPVATGAKASFDVRIAARRVRSRNVVARLEGTDRKDEHLIYTAHWDHLGRNPALSGDQIFNGALDNATGTAGLLQLARAFKALAPPPRRSVLFLALTGEEKGLVGAKYYAAHPLYPLATTVANINIDELNPWGPTDDMTVVGYGNTTLDDLLGRVLAADLRQVTPDQEPEKGFYYRSDHFEFAKQGVPALYVGIGTRFKGRSPAYGAQRRAAFDEGDYHKPSDEIKPDWDLNGAIDDLRALFRLGVAVANADSPPQWKPGTEFKARRDSMLAAPR